MVQHMAPHLIPHTSRLLVLARNLPGCLAQLCRLPGYVLQPLLQAPALAPGLGPGLGVGMGMGMGSAPGVGTGLGTGLGASGPRGASPPRWQLPPIAPSASSPLRVGLREVRPLVLSGPPPWSVARAAVQGLDVSTRALVGRWLVFPASFDVAGACAVGAVPEAVTHAALEDLARVGLASKEGQGRWQLCLPPDHGLSPPEDALPALVTHTVRVLCDADALYDSSAVLSGLYLFDVERASVDLVLGLAAGVARHRRCGAANTLSEGVQEALLGAVECGALLAARVPLGVRADIRKGLLVIARGRRPPGHLDLGIAMHYMAAVLVSWCVVWCGVVWCGVVWCGVVWCSVCVCVCCAWIRHR